MRLPPLMTALLIASLMLTSPQGTAAKDQESALIDELRTLVQKSREQRAADRWLQRALDDLVAKYDWPWQRELMYEDFSDGDYTRNPVWQVVQGDFFCLLKDAFDQLWLEGERHPKMMSIGLHSRISGHPARAKALARFLDYIQEHDAVWVCRREEIARHWIANKPA